MKLISMLLTVLCCSFAFATNPVKELSPEYIKIQDITCIKSGCQAQTTKGVYSFHAGLLDVIKNLKASDSPALVFTSSKQEIYFALHPLLGRLVARVANDWQLMSQIELNRIEKTICGDETCNLSRTITVEHEKVQINYLVSKSLMNVMAGHQGQDVELVISHDNQVLGVMVNSKTIFTDLNLYFF